MSLIDICYEHIKDSYYYGLFGDFKLIIDKKTGCFNATKLCNLGGKRYIHWKSLDKSKNLINYVINNRYRDVDTGFYEIKGDNNEEITKKITGQYVPKEIILDISSWLSPEFYLKCNDVIINYYNNEFKKMSEYDIDYKLKEMENKYTNIIEEKDEQLKFKDDRIDYLISQNNIIIESNKNLENQNKQLLYLAEKQNIKLDEIGDELEETNYKLDILTETVEEIILPDRNIPPKDENLKHNLVIYKNNDVIKIMRAQNKYINKTNIPTDNIIIKEYVPNPIDFINRMKLYCKEINKQFKKELRKTNKNLPFEDFIDLYDSNKKMEIKYNNILLNNSSLIDINILFDKLKQEQYEY
ncbi:N1R/p28-like protein [Adoxophyes honmai entomopoxvirus 'L']|uniref:N1R/p28-like protein n=1 Tax=Adoxophyes honmai entomopoxvirus 'L' TaxID=1293540 RepID=A0A916KNR0_9POXV|nr:N1R/p28-like protein [Adoxophyes honmai entomopoxvirus 'L']YP_008004070.1 N1R/p28-like protein [Adoxophyes honmai entomopoxvirus 'L']CCU55322.1 N1R/p28-like protein [Adoxophyes honmai entomopoxvirus 'L']CCU55568.1 N1R/p28-like protein [Adoxophyes honmai entomopoxvirus 'L']